MTILRPLLMQASGGDATFPYSAQEHRALVSAMLAEGVLGTTDLRVSQRSAGANFTVDVAAGKAVVLGDSVANQGSYLITNDAALTGIVIPAAPASGTRTHRVILKVRDRAHDGSVTAGLYDATVLVLEDTGTGTPALPASAITLATVTVASTTTSITDAAITNGRPVATTLARPAARTITRIPLPLASGWTSMAGTEMDPVYWKDDDGIVHVVGNIRNDNAYTPSLAFIVYTLPVGFRPEGLSFRAIPLSSGASVQFDLRADGTCRSIRGADVAAAVVHSLDMHFPAA